MSGSCNHLASIGLSGLATPNIKSQMFIVLLEGLVPCSLLRSDVQLQVKLYFCFCGRKLTNVILKCSNLEDVLKWNLVQNMLFKFCNSRVSVVFCELVLFSNSGTIF